MPAHQNLPIGRISLGEVIIAEGKNAIWQPDLSLHRHAEMEALASIPLELRGRAPDMVLYTTLEPCLMCMGAILLYKIGKVIFGSSDPIGGANVVIGSLPPYFKDRLSKTDWIGPAFTEECDPLFQRIIDLEKFGK
jgi:tRNA(Arg) A34 adenosine deaminase TadA